MELLILCPGVYTSLPQALNSTLELISSLPNLSVVQFFNYSNNKLSTKQHELYHYEKMEGTCDDTYLSSIKNACVLKVIVL